MGHYADQHKAEKQRLHIILQNLGTKCHFSHEGFLRVIDKRWICAAKEMTKLVGLIYGYPKFHSAPGGKWSFGSIRILRSPIRIWLPIETRKKISAGLKKSRIRKDSNYNVQFKIDKMGGFSMPLVSIHRDRKGKRTTNKAKHNSQIIVPLRIFGIWIDINCTLVPIPFCMLAASRVKSHAKRRKSISIRPQRYRYRRRHHHHKRTRVSSGVKVDNGHNRRTAPATMAPSTSPATTDFGNSNREKNILEDHPPRTLQPLRVSQTIKKSRKKSIRKMTAKPSSSAPVMTVTDMENIGRKASACIAEAIKPLQDTISSQQTQIGMLTSSCSRNTDANAKIMATLATIKSQLDKSSGDIQNLITSGTAVNNAAIVGGMNAYRRRGGFQPMPYWEALYDDHEIYERRKGGNAVVGRPVGRPRKR